MIVTVDIPDHFARQFHLDEAPRSRELLQTFVLQRYAEGQLSAGQVGEVLGLSFQETEQFLYDNHAPGLGLEEHLQGLKNLEQFWSR